MKTPFKFFAIPTIFKENTEMEGCHLGGSVAAGRGTAVVSSCNVRVDLVREQIPEEFANPL